MALNEQGARRCPPEKKQRRSGSWPPAGSSTLAPNRSTRRASRPHRHRGAGAPRALPETL
eukprot:1067066-Pyramimonas_sp.AAC.1